MNKERSLLIEWLRGEVVGPQRPIREPELAQFSGRVFTDANSTRTGPLVWQPDATNVAVHEEVLYFQGEAPHRKYGCGVLHPDMQPDTAEAPAAIAAQVTDTVGIDVDRGDDDDDSDAQDSLELDEAADEFEVTSPDVRRPSSFGVSLRVRLEETGTLRVALPPVRRFSWQQDDSTPFKVNGRYEECDREIRQSDGLKQFRVWRRVPATSYETVAMIPATDLKHGVRVERVLTMAAGCPVTLRADVYPRRIKDGSWLITVVVRNTTQLAAGQGRDVTLYQSYFEVSAVGGCILPYPESPRPFSQMDDDEKSLTLLYREAATWGIGHGCAAGWDVSPGEAPPVVYADSLPTVELPSMTPDIADSAGRSIRLSMRTLASLGNNGAGEGWVELQALVDEYDVWLERQRKAASELVEPLSSVAHAHVAKGRECLARMRAGLDILKSDARARDAFKLANQSMLLQQIATKHLKRRALVWDAPQRRLTVGGSLVSPADVYRSRKEGVGVGWWRAFQIAFMLMSVPGLADEQSGDREIVDLIWFPTGGGKTEAYLGVLAFYLFHQRLLPQHGPRRDGTNALMRYTLRMLTTQQFQRAASLICAMEYLRRGAPASDVPAIPGRRFALGLWIGGSATPNTIPDANKAVRAFRADALPGNPLVLTECPWCRAEIGRYDGDRPTNITPAQWKALSVKGINDTANGPLLLCSDSRCEFGKELSDSWLPIEVIDQRIYDERPSLIIATADKLAMMAFRPDAGKLFGNRRLSARGRELTHVPPGLIIQDELHLISGPLGTMYALYESVFEQFSSHDQPSGLTKPKLIASTATIRGASDQVLALFGRRALQLFPSPGLTMGDSFFGRYATADDGRPKEGRLYVGIHAVDYGSILTTQVRAFSSVLFRPQFFDKSRRDAWWTLLAFYNSIRELSGAKTLFDSDIQARLKFLFNRDGISPDQRRPLRAVEELTSRLSQAEIVAMMDRLGVEYMPNVSSIDACLASNIIEVGVDIDRLSLMGVVGQPKTTAQYIQVTGRVGRRWAERPGLILTVYNPSKSRDRSHFEQFHSYHRRLYERVEPTTATPFAVSAIQRAAAGVLLTWARQFSSAEVTEFAQYEQALSAGLELLRRRCRQVQQDSDVGRSVEELERVWTSLKNKWQSGPMEWGDKFPPSSDGEYLMLWPGQFATQLQKVRGVVVPTSMRQVDASAELHIADVYALSSSN